MYTRLPMRSSENSESGTAVADREETSESDLRGRMNAVHNRARQFMQTLVRTKASAAHEIDGLKHYFAGMRLKESGDDGIRQREVFFHGDGGSEGWGAKMERDAIRLYEEFTKRIDEATSKKAISSESKRKWIERFENKSIGFKAKEYWVRHQMPYYMESWQKAAEDRKKLAEDKGFKDLVNYDARFAVIGKEDEFLNMHFDKRKGLLAEARAALSAGNKLQLDLYANARSLLQDAASRGILAHGKVGTWLERVFKGKHDAKKVKQFISGGGSNDLPNLLRRWEGVKGRYDLVARNFRSKGGEQLPRGAHLVSESQFLNMHYEQRMHYVEEMEKRLDHGSDLSRESPSFVKIRHAIDSKDFTEAGLLIADAKREALSEENRARLDSMSRFVKQFTPKQNTDSIDDVTQAKLRLDELTHQVPSSIQPMVMRLLRGRNGNRSINQFRWIVYNNKWCRSHGHLNDDVAFKGASQDHKEETKFRAERGMDVGRHDVLDGETADKDYIRKKEFSDHKATYLHVNTNGGAPTALGEWLEREQDPKVLYWTTFCGHEDGLPKGESWHNDLFAILTEMRGLTRKINGSGFMYAGPNHHLVGMN